MRPRSVLRRTAALTAALLLTLTACGADPVTGEGDAAPDGQAEPGAEENVTSALDDPRSSAFPEPLIDPNLIRAVLGPDRIPAIDDPKFQRARNVDWLGADEPLLSLTVGEETRGYPLQVMTWHEIVNDTVGRTPVAVTYCPLCNSGVAFEREAAGRVLTFGTSGRLYADNLVMYDRQTESLWPQLTGQAAVGVLTGTQLTAIPMGVVGWSDFRSEHPDALVLTRDTGHRRDYGRNPYTGYDQPGSELLFSLPVELDERLSAKTRVIGAEVGGEAVAVDRDRLAVAGVFQVEVGGRDLVFWHRPGQNSALDSSAITEGQDIGTAAVFDTELGGRSLTFTVVGDGFRDEQTGSQWNVLGRAVRGELEGARLTPVTHLDTFWFSWVVFHPDTELVR